MTKGLSTYVVDPFPIDVGGFTGLPLRAEVPVPRVPPTPADLAFGAPPVLYGNQGVVQQPPPAPPPANQPPAGSSNDGGCCG